MADLGSNQIDSDNKLRDNEYNSCTTPKCSKPNYDVHKNHNHLPNNLSYDNCKANNFRILHQDIWGISHKIDEFLISLYNAPPVLCLSEHHLRTEEIENVNLGQCTLGAQFCRQSYKQGGVSIYVSKDIQFNTINLDQYNREIDLEICALKIRLLPNNLAVICIYRSPTGNFTYFLNQLESILNKIKCQLT
jgi:hypothetical protein